MKRTVLNIVLFLAALLLLEACSHQGIYTKGYFRRGTTATAPTPEPTTGDYYVVQKGETLYSIAWVHGYDHRQIAYWNNIKPPYTIFPQQRIRVTPPPATIERVPSPTKHKKTYKKTTTDIPYKAKSYPSGKVRWHWPTKGRILSTFSHNDAGRKGVDIGGRIGQAVRAAADGKVVYSGNGLRGYGNLIIVKHNEEYFSAYAHNNKNLVKENQIVKANQKIADMGNSGTNQVMLHFEIRRDGKPVNPLSYLPKYRK